jgi:hypothetical protein
MDLSEGAEEAAPAYVVGVVLVVKLAPIPQTSQCFGDIAMRFS